MRLTLDNIILNGRPLNSEQRRKLGNQIRKYAIIGHVMSDGKRSAAWHLGGSIQDGKFSAAARKLLNFSL